MPSLLLRLLFVVGAGTTLGCNGSKSADSCDGFVPTTVRECASRAHAWCTAERGIDCDLDAGISSEVDAGPRDVNGTPLECPASAQVVAAGARFNDDAGECCYDLQTTCTGRPLCVEGRGRIAPLVRGRAFG